MTSPEGNLFDDDDPWNRVRVAAAAFAAVILGGTIAYRALGLSWIDAVYQTLITVSTVGFTEVGSDIGPTYRIVTSVLIITGVGIAVYALGLVVEALMEGRIRRHMGRSRMQRQLDRLRDHVVICGWGQVGQAIGRDLIADGLEIVVVDRRPDLYDVVGGPLAVVGEATHDWVLQLAGISRARALVVALDGDADNLFVTLSGRALNPNLFIVTRAVDPQSSPKLIQAGADRAVNPHEVGALRMASFVMQPNVADFLAETMHDESLHVRLGEYHLRRCQGISDGTVANFCDSTGLTVLAIRRSDGSFEHRPQGDHSPGPGDVMIALGTRAQHDNAQRLSTG